MLRIGAPPKRTLPPKSCPAVSSVGKMTSRRKELPKSFEINFPGELLKMTVGYVLGKSCQLWDWAKVRRNISSFPFKKLFVALTGISNLVIIFHFPADAAAAVEQGLCRNPQLGT